MKAARQRGCRLPVAPPPPTTGDRHSGDSDTTYNTTTSGGTQPVCRHPAAAPEQSEHHTAEKAGSGTGSTADEGARKHSRRHYQSGWFLKHNVDQSLPSPESRQQHGVTVPALPALIPRRGISLARAAPRLLLFSEIQSRVTDFHISAVYRVREKRMSNAIENLVGTLVQYCYAPRYDGGSW